MNVLITGGAGFIGTHLSRRLLREGCHVAVFDCFHPQVHGGHRDVAPDIEKDVEVIEGDVRARDVFHAALDGRDVVVHLAAETGTGQSMYELLRYEAVNIGGTALLLDYLTNSSTSDVERVVVASSRAVYGEGRYRCDQHGEVYPEARQPEDLAAGRFEPKCPHCGGSCTPEATPESAPLRPTSFYGLTKQVQEQMILMYAEALDFSACALRYQNVYGPGQSLRNPYTGVLAIFSTLAREDRPIRVFEDGRPARDFVHVKDVVDATWKCIHTPGATGVYNVGSGVGTTIHEVASAVVEGVGSDSTIQVTGDFRVGDIRRNVADLSRIRRSLGYEPSWDFRIGLADFLDWAVAQRTPELALDVAETEMRRAGLQGRVGQG